MALTKDRDRGLDKQLAVIASLPYHLSRLPLREGLSLALDALLKVTRSEAAELFLREPVTGDIVLAAHRGPFRNAFFQLTRFRPGEGYPGIIAVKKEPIFTTNLQTDPRFLRTRVKDLGFRSYLCVPIEFGDELVGSLNLASRESRRDYPEYKRLLSWAAPSIAMAVRLRLYEVEKLFETSLARITGETGRNLDFILKDLLSNVATLSEANVLAATWYDNKSDRLMSLAVKGSKEKNACIPELTSKCPSLVNSSPVELFRNHQLPEVACRGILKDIPGAVCFPLKVGDTCFGAVSLAYPDKGELLEGQSINTQRF